MFKQRVLFPGAETANNGGATRLENPQYSFQMSIQDGHDGDMAAIAMIKDDNNDRQNLRYYDSRSP